VLILLVIAAFKPDIYYIMVVSASPACRVIANLIAGKIAFSSTEELHRGGARARVAGAHVILKISFG